MPAPVANDTCSKRKLDELSLKLEELAERQSNITVEIRNVLDSCGIKFEEYCDWLNDYCLWEGDQIDRLVELYFEKLKGDGNA